MTYQDNREAIPGKHGQSAYEDLPDAETYARIAVASGHVQLAKNEIMVLRQGQNEAEMIQCTVDICRIRHWGHSKETSRIYKPCQ